MTFTFEIVSKKYGRFTVTAPLRFRAEIEEHTWFVNFDPSRTEGRQFTVGTNIYAKGKRVEIVSLHRFIWRLAGKEAVPIIDHKDGQPLNNDEDNLRGASYAQNNRNLQSNRKDNTSGFTGVSWNKRDRRFYATIRINGKKKHIGCYSEAIEAARAYDAEALEHFRDFASLNFPEEAFDE